MSDYIVLSIFFLVNVIGVRIFNFLNSIFWKKVPYMFSFTFGWNGYDTDPDSAPDLDWQAQYAYPDPP